MESKQLAEAVQDELPDVVRDYGEDMDSMRLGLAAMRIRLREQTEFLRDAFTKMPNGKWYLGFRSSRYHGSVELVNGLQDKLEAMNLDA